jgi:hypothetical protein
MSTPREPPCDYRTYANEAALDPQTLERHRQWVESALRAAEAPQAQKPVSGTASDKPRRRPPAIAPTPTWQ